MSKSAGEDDDKGTSWVDFIDDFGWYSGGKDVRDVDGRMVRKETEDSGRSVPKAARN